MDSASRRAHQLAYHRRHTTSARSHLPAAVRDELSGVIYATAYCPASPSQIANPRDGARVPIFVVGMHRSGTTWLEQLLDGHSKVQGGRRVYDFTCQMRQATDYHCRGVLDTALVERGGPRKEKAAKSAASPNARTG